MCAYGDDDNEWAIFGWLMDGILSTYLEMRKKASMDDDVKNADRNDEVCFE